MGKDIEELFEENEHTKSARKVLADLTIVGTVGQDDKNSTSSQGDNLGHHETKFGVSTLYGIKIDEKMN
jgi:hypothetical protein